MAKESGLGMSLTVQDSSPTAQNIANDVTSLDFATPRGIQEITGIDKLAMERLLLLADFSCTLNGIFNDDGNKSFAVLKTIPSTTVDRLVKITISGQILGGPNGIVSVASDFSLSRAASGEMTWVAPFALTGGAVPTWA